MAEDDSPQSGSALNRLMSTKILGLPLPVVAGATVAAALILYRVFGKKGTTGTTANNGQGTQFSSTTTSTNPQTGVSTSYTASGNGYLPGVLGNFQASPMPYSGGDIYINYPSGNTSGTSTTPTQPVNPKDIDDPNAYGRSQIQTIQGLVGKGEYTQQIVDDVKAAYDAEAKHYGQQYADLQHYSYMGPGNVQAIPRHLTAAQQITTGLPTNPKWGQFYQNAFNEAYPGLGSGISTGPTGAGGQNGA